MASYAACLSAGSHLLVSGLLLRNAVLPSKQLVDSGLAAPAPLAFNLSSSGNASLLLQGCTVSTSCDNLAQFAAWVAGGQPQLLLQPYVIEAAQVGWSAGWYECVGVPACCKVCLFHCFCCAGVYIQ